MTDFEKVKKAFKDSDLLTLALTHKSWVNENPDKRNSNERLEFLGDAILEFVTSNEIYTNFPDKEEGYLTALRAKLVNTISLAKVARKLELGEKLFLSKGEEKEGGRNNTSLLANTVEALIGAIFLDRGLEPSSDFIKSHILVEIPRITKEPLKDAKSRLQELVQAQGLPAPKYEVVSESGPDHNKKFTVEAKVAKNTLGKGKGKNKGEAAQKAAEAALAKR